MQSTKKQNSLAADLGYTLACALYDKKALEDPGPTEEMGRVIASFQNPSFTGGFMAGYCDMVGLTTRRVA